MKKILNGLILASALMAVPVFAIQCGFDDTMNTMLNDFIDANNIPGGVISIKLPNHAVCTYTAGYADLATKKQMSGNTLFSVGSITKSFTTVAIQQLELTGQVKYSDTLSTLAAKDSVLKDVVKKYPKLGEITLKEIVNHTSGIPDVYTSPAYTKLFLKNPEFHTDAAHLIKMAMLQKPGPRGAFHYSNTDYILAGLVIESVTGKPLSTTENTLLISAQIKQAILPDALKTNLPETVTSDIAHGYLSQNTSWSPTFTHAINHYNRVFIEGNQEAITAFDVTPIDLAQLSEGSAAGEMLMTVPDMVKWYDYLFASQTASQPVAHDPETVIGTGITMNYLPRYGLTVYTHNASVFGFNTNLIYIKDNNIIIALALNAQHDKARLNQQLAVAILDHLKEAGYFMQTAKLDFKKKQRPHIQANIAV